MKKLNALLFLGLLIIFSCSSDSDSDNDQDDQDDTPIANVLCDGNGSNSYFPLAMGNYWKWEDPFNSPLTPDTTTAEVIDTFEYQGVTYFELEFTGTNGQYHFKYLREDAQGNLKVLVYFESVAGNYYEEHTVIPSMDTFESGDQWEFYSALDENDFIEPVQRVQSVGTLDTDDCSYENAIEIFTRNLQADPSIPQLAILDYKVYKKGIGIVSFEGRELTEIILN